MDDLLGKIILFIVGLIVVAMVLSASVVVVPVLVGVVGFLMVKTKVPLVNPNGPPVIPIIYAFAWGAAISFGLFAGSVMASQMFWPLHQWPVAQRLAFFKTVAIDGAAFFLETAFILIAALGVSGSKLAHRNILQASAVTCGVASLLLTFTPLPNWGGGYQIATESFRRVIQTIIFPLTLAAELVGGLNRTWSKLYDWVWASNGNLFALTSGLSKILWVVMFVQAGRALLEKPTTGIQRETTSSLTGAEWGRLILVLVWVSAIGVIVYNHESYQSSEVFFKWAFALLATYVGLVWTLWKARPHRQ